MILTIDNFLKRNTFVIPTVVFLLIILGVTKWAICLEIAIILGVVKIVVDSFEHIKVGKYSLDYIAFLAMVVSSYSGEYLAGAFIALMFTGGEALETFASNRAESALRSLGDTIPKKCLIKRDGSFVELPIQDVEEGDIIIIKNGEIIPLDGRLISPKKVELDMANLTGEALPVAFSEGMLIKSGAVNKGEVLELAVVGDFSSSTYHKIVNLVNDAKSHPSPTVRISEEANIYFTLLTLFIASIVYIVTGDITRLLAVLVIATPCPLIIAAPVAFVAGMSKSARYKILIRRPIAFELIQKSHTVFFDKTGTLTLGEPALRKIHIFSTNENIKNEDDVLAVASAIETHSLHPIARAVVAETMKRNISYDIAGEVKETVGSHIEGLVDGVRYVIGSSKEQTSGICLSLCALGKDDFNEEGSDKYESKKEIARLYFSDTLKDGAKSILSKLEHTGIHTAIITGDKKENAEAVFHGLNVKIYAEQSPEDKFSIIDNAKKKGDTVVMIGDGLNDAPALAKADVGIVFSGSENGASVEAADVAILGHDMKQVSMLFGISHRTVSIARQSIYGGIVLSIIGMILASFGLIEPVTGAIVQECIDVIVILNALRALR